jgi:hypothetical protein
MDHEVIVPVDDLQRAILDTIPATPDANCQGNAAQQLQPRHHRIS